MKRTSLVSERRADVDGVQTRGAVCGGVQYRTLHPGLDAELERAAGEASEMEERLDKAAKDHPARPSIFFTRYVVAQRKV